jgi:hypothetical protein
MLDIGPGRGALVVYAPQSLLGEEIEIRPHGEDWAGAHTAVRARHVGDRVLHAGVFGSLAAGRYDIRLRTSSAEGGPGQVIEVASAVVVETTLVEGAAVGGITG